MDGCYLGLFGGYGCLVLDGVVVLFCEGGDKCWELFVIQVLEFSCGICCILKLVRWVFG